MNSKLINTLLFKIVPFVVLFIFSFKIKDEHPTVILNIQGDTVYYDSSIPYAEQLFYYDLIIKNSTNKLVKLHDGNLLPAYKGNLSNDYYLEIYKDENGKKIDFNVEERHFMEVDYLFKPVFLKIGESLTFKNSSYMYQLKEPGKYYIRAIFVNACSSLGQSNIDSIVVVKK
ncbi:hypothetical protein [Sphingobacterium sp. DR205]|uniref:hypothetical protein n=1 Tax=Sphingobacterium sp. DR205 TaxID=2713573 RepID=UPI0013E41C42|nr:hypothetical protein [Sphingobacterium sp. DR205]QIH33490.1 hypothetical protein G6053_11595 [Sphingobacterium sp. DR205]